MTIRKGSNIIAGNPSLTSVVTLDTPQTITSPKTFTGITMVPTATAGTNDGKAASTEFVNNAISLYTIILPGMVAIWAGTTVPEGYLLCDGSAVSRTTYSALFSAIGTTYGPGDSSSTFNLPNFQGRYLKQGTVGTYGVESLPNITGRIGDSTGGCVAIYMNAESKTDKSLYVAKISEYGMNNVGPNTDTHQYSLLLDASRSSSTSKSSPSSCAPFSSTSPSRPS